MKFSVTQQDIDKGEKFSALNDPIALAMTRKLELEPGDVVVGMHYVCIDPWLTTVSLPVRAQRFIREFEDGDPVEPFEFEIQAIEED